MAGYPEGNCQICHDYYPDLGVHNKDACIANLIYRLAELDKKVANCRRLLREAREYYRYWRSDGVA